MAILYVQVAASVCSTLFRFCTWFFLRWIPATQFRWILPTLFGLYLLLFTIGEFTNRGAASPLKLAPTVEVVEAETLVEVDVDDVPKVEGPTEPEAAGTPEGTKAEKEEPAGNGDAEEKDVTVTVVEQTTTTSITLEDRAEATHDAALSIIFTLPSSSLFLRLVSLLINVLFVLFAADFLLRPFLVTFPDLTYARVGAVTHSSAKIVFRYPLPVWSSTEAPASSKKTGKVETLLDLSSDEIRVWWREKSDPSDTDISSWIEGPIVDLQQENDWVGVVKLDKLLPLTEYEYRFAFANASFLPYPPRPLSFKTFPDPRLVSGAHFKFLASSCLMPDFPYAPSLSLNPRIKGFDMIADTLQRQYLARERAAALAAAEGASPIQAPAPAEPSEPAPAPLPSADAPQQPLAEPAHAHEPTETPEDDQASPARTNAVPDLGTLLQGVSPLSLLFRPKPKQKIPEVEVSDADVEFMLLLGDFIYADVPWYGGDDLEKGYQRLYRRVYASDSYKKVYEKIPTLHIYDDHEIDGNYIGNANDSQPPFPNADKAYAVYQNSANYDPIRPGANYYEFQYGDVAFFVMDCRRYRTASEQEVGPTATMLGEEQLADLHTWLARVNHTATFKFVVSSVPFTALWAGLDGQIDTWAGYPTERHNLLLELASVPNVIIISGDRHEFAAVASTVPTGSILEISTSPLNQFYVPLVNSFDVTGKRGASYTIEQNETRVNEAGEPELVTVEKTWSEERVLRYQREGNHKWSSFEVDTRDPEHPKLIIDLYTDGQRTYHLSSTGKPVHKIPPITALGHSISANLKNAMDALGIWKALGLN